MVLCHLGQEIALQKPLIKVLRIMLPASPHPVVPIIVGDSRASLFE